MLSSKLSYLVLVRFTTSMYFKGIANDDSFETYNFSLGITWSQYIISRDILQTSSQASIASRSAPETSATPYFSCTESLLAHSWPLAKS